MKVYTLAIAALFVSQITTGQIIKDGFGQQYATDEKTTKVVADPAKYQPGYRYGFNVEFEFVFGREINRQVSYVAQIEKIVIRKDIGFFNQYYSEKTGTYYPCSKLENLCETTELVGINIVATWEYNGQQYKTGSITMVSRRDDKSFLKKPVEITPPGGGVIPQDAVKSGAAKVVNIEVVSCSVNTTDPIMRIVDSLFSQKKK